MMFKPLIVSFFVVPAEFAYYSAVMVISSAFCTIGAFGYHYSLQRELPVFFLRERVRIGRVLVLQNVFITILVLLILVFVTLSSPNFAGLTDNEIITALFHGFSQQLFLIATMESKSFEQNKRYSYQNLSRSIIVVIFVSIMCASYSSAKFVILSEFFINTLTSLAIMYVFLSKDKLGLLGISIIALKKIKDIDFNASFALMLVSITGYLCANIDRWYGVLYLDSKSFSYYSFAGIILISAYSVQAVINSFFYTVLVRAYAEKGKLEAFRYVFRLSSALLLLGIVISFPAYWITQLIINNLWMQYAESIRILPYLFIISAMAVSDFYTSYLIVVREEVKLLILKLTVTLVGFFFWWVFFITEQDALLRVTLLGFIVALFNYLFVFFMAVRCFRK